MKRDMRFPTVNFRMAVMDLCETTGLREHEILENLYEGLDRFDADFPNRKNAPVWFMFAQYNLPHTSALSYIYGIKAGIIQWDHPVDTVYDGPLPEPIPFEQFDLSLQDLFLVLSPMIDKEDLEALRHKWKYSVVLERPPGTGRERQRNATKSFKETLQHDANALAAEWDKMGKKYIKQTIANALVKEDKYLGMNPATLERNFRLPRNLSRYK